MKDSGLWRIFLFAVRYLFTYGFVLAPLAGSRRRLTATHHPISKLFDIALAGNGVAN
jgi:hypothetical protein